MAGSRIGVLVMAHGTPRRPEDIEAFYTRIRRGNPPSPDQLGELVRRYEAIGGLSPLTAHTAAQVAGLAQALERREPGRFVVRYGAKHVAPLIEESAAALRKEDVAAVVGLVLTPHRSRAGSEEYLARAGEALGDDRPFLPVGHWYDTPGFPPLLARRVAAAQARLPDGTLSTTTVLFSAHSIPQRLVHAGDVYPDQVHDSAALVAGAAGRERWQVVWQSAGLTPEPWLGPDLRDVLRMIGAGPQGGESGAPAVVVCPIGFVADHLEVLYDIDIEAEAVAQASGVAMVRTSSLNDDPAFLSLLADVVQHAVRHRDDDRAAS